MFGYTKILWPVIAGICLYAGVMHLQIGLRKPLDRIHILFGALALLISLGVFGNIALTTAQSPDAYLRAAWYSSFVTTSVFIVLPWFVSYYAIETDHRIAAALSALYAVILIGNCFFPYSMMQSAMPVLQQVTLPWGETIVRSSTPPTSWFNLIWFGHALTILYLLYACIHAARRGPRERAWGLIIGMGCFALALTVNFLVRWGVIANHPYVAAPGFLALVLVMGVALTREWRQSHQQMKTILDNVPAVVHLKKLDGRYLFVNRHFESLYRIPSGSTVGKTDAQLFDSIRAAAHAQADQKALASGLIESEEIIEQDGKPRTYATLLFALRNPDGHAQALCGITTDITEREATTKALRELTITLEHRVSRRTSELAKLNEELEAFAYSVSHDLRAPLTAINGFAELLLREHGPKLDQTANRFLNRIREGSIRMAGLIQDLLGLSRVTQQGLQREDVDLIPIVETIVKALRETEPTRDVHFEAPAQLIVYGDAKLLNLALANLLGNAWKYTGKTAAARVEMGTIEQDGTTAIYIKDNGAGFNPDYSERLFRPFVRLHAESEFPGTGIGLATVSRIVNRHGGRLWATAKPNEGATFFFTLPPREEDIPLTGNAK